MEVLFWWQRGNTVQNQNKESNKTKKAYIACLMVIRPKEGRNRITVRVYLMGSECFRRETWEKCKGESCPYPGLMYSSQKGKPEQSHWSRSASSGRTWRSVSPGVCKEKSSSRGQRSKCQHGTNEEAGNIDIEAGKSLQGMHALNREQATCY